MTGPAASYAPSGRVDGSRLAVVGVVGLASCAALGALYQLAVQAMPLLWFRCLYTLGAALILAVLCGPLSAAAHVRGHALALAIGSLWGLAAVVGSFAAVYRSELHAFSQFDGALFDGVDMLDPPGFLEVLRGRIEGGWVVGRVREINGIFVLLVWLLEAAIFVYACARGALPSVYRPFCETCRRFATPQFASVFRVDASTLRLAGARGDVDAVLAAPGAGKGARLARYEVSACPICGNVGWLDVRLEYAGKHLATEEDPSSGPDQTWLDDLLAGCAGSLAALGGSPSRRSPEYPIRGAVLDRPRMEALRQRPQERR